MKLVSIFCSECSLYSQSNRKNKQNVPIHQTYNPKSAGWFTLVKRNARKFRIKIL